MQQQTGNGAFLDSWKSACSSLMSWLQNTHSWLNRHLKVHPQASGIAQTAFFPPCLLTKQWSECSRRWLAAWWLVKTHYSNMVIKINGLFQWFGVFGSSVSQVIHGCNDVCSICGFYGSNTRSRLDVVINCKALCKCKKHSYPGNLSCAAKELISSEKCIHCI